MDWISEMTARIARATALDPAELSIDAPSAELLLDLAGIAAHASGDRTNAPLLCHVLGRAVAHGARLEDCAQVVRSASAAGDA